jgi:hypothetical protein
MTAIKTYGRPEVQLHAFLTSALDGGGRGVKLTTHFRLVPRLRMHGAMPLLLPTFLWCGTSLNIWVNFALQDGSEWSASRPDRFTPGVRAPGTH